MDTKEKPMPRHRYELSEQIANKVFKMNPNNRLHKCPYKTLCEYKRVESDYCDLTDDERADCCPKNII